MNVGGLALDTAAWASPWRARSVRDKAFLAFGLLALVLWLPPWPGTVLVALTCVLLLLGPARVSARLLVRCLAGPAVFVVTGAASVLVSLRWSGGPSVAVTADQAAQAAELFGRGIAGALAVLVLAATTPVLDLISAGRRAHVPDICLEVAALTYRFVFVLLESARTIHQAQVARLGDVDRRTALRSAAGLAAAVFVRSWERARRLEDGLAGRGYTESLRTLDPPRTASVGFVASAAALFVVLAVTAVLVAGWRP